jgi:hypothetical protein
MSKAIFKAILRQDPDFREILRGLSKQEDFRKFILGNLDCELVFTIERSADKKEKMRMWSYLNSIVISEYVKALFNSGISTDKAEALWNLKTMFLKDTKIDFKGNEHIFVPSTTDLNKIELFLFIQKVLMHLEVDYGVLPPDAEAYKSAKVSGDTKKIMWKIK